MTKQKSRAFTAKDARVIIGKSILAIILAVCSYAIYLSMVTILDTTTTIEPSEVPFEIIITIVVLGLAVIFTGGGTGYCIASIVEQLQD